MGRGKLSIHAKVKDYAKLRGMTMTELYERLGYTQQNYYTIVKRESISLKQLRKIAQVLKVQICDLI